jgi:hypothetical protein
MRRTDERAPGAEATSPSTAATGDPGR